MTYRIAAAAILITLWCAPAGAQTMGFAEAADALNTACGADIEAHCQGMNIGHDRIRSCLASSPKVSGQCKAALPKIIASINARFAAQAATLKVCEPDYRQLCRDVVRGDGNILDCLLKAKNAVGAKCNQALTDAGWR